jgi:hypothetical protein
MELLQDIISRLDNIQDDEETLHTIYAVRIGGEWQPFSPAIVVETPMDRDADDEEPERPDGTEYLLEVSLAQEAVKHYRKYGPSPLPSIEDLCRAVIHYAVEDCYGPYSA